MHRSETLVKQILFGFDLENAYFRIDPTKGKVEELFRMNFQFQLLILPSFIFTGVPARRRHSPDQPGTGTRRHLDHSGP